MSIPYMPHRFETSKNLDVESINDNLDASARVVRESLDKRFSYSSHTFLLDGVTDASTAVLRTVPIRAPKSGNLVEVCGVEVSLYDTTTGTWTVTCSDPTWPTLDVAVASSTAEAHALSGSPVSVPTTGSTDLTFTLSSATASTIGRGYVVVHLRCDRGSMGTSHAGYVPALFDSRSATAGSTLDTEIDAIAAAVARDTTNSIDLRCTAFTVKGLAGTAATLLFPAGTFRVHRVTGYSVAVAGADLAVSLAATSLTTVSFTVTSTGATARATNGANAGAVAVPFDDPSDVVTLTLSRSGAGTIDLAHVLVWWS